MKTALGIIAALLFGTTLFFAMHGHHHSSCNCPEKTERDCVEFSYDILQHCLASDRKPALAYSSQISECTDQAERMHELCED